MAKALRRFSHRWRWGCRVGRATTFKASNCMIELSGIARQLRLPVEKIKIAADLLEQGYQPAFIQRYRADETGCLPRTVLWTLKLEIDRQKRLEDAREKAVKHLPKDAELDEEGRDYLAKATTEVEIEAALRAFRARRAWAQSQDREGHGGQLLERMIAYDGPPIENLQAWAAEQLSVDEAAAEQSLQSAERLISQLMHCDTKLNQNLRRSIQRKAQIRVEFCQPEAGEREDSSDPDSSNSDSSSTTAASENGSSESLGAAKPSEGHDQGSVVQATEASVAADSNSVASDQAQPSVQQNPVPAAEGETQADQGSRNPPAEQPGAEQPGTELQAVQAGAEQAPPTQADDSLRSVSEGVVTADSPDRVTVGSDVTEGSEGPDASSGIAGGNSSDAPENAPSNGMSEQSDTDKKQSSPLEGANEEGGIRAKSKPLGPAKEKRVKPDRGAKKSVAKLTPRQRRRRWLIAMLQPMKSLKKPVSKLTAYQQLMLGRGRRSQLVLTELVYDQRALVGMGRDTFVTDKHPLVKWFSNAVEAALEAALRVRIEQDAVNDLEELASEKLLETAADQLRATLMQRPVRGHCILVIDAVGPKMAGVAVVGPDGTPLQTDEISCSGHPDVVNQNVVRLGEMVHKHRVTLVALTNGPARRFLVLTMRELMKQSAESGLRWTMADRGGADPYAAGRTALKELSAYNRRDRASIWVARSLQSPLLELLKVDTNRLRLGSYQRELPQGPLKQLVRETISDCVCGRGVDTLRASVDELLYVTGVEPEQAQQIAKLASQGAFQSRQEMLEQVSNWSETSSRQAIGTLRVFGSPQPLDATTIHPDDYRLAERLIQNSEFSEPANAPPGWVKPETRREDQPATITQSTGIAPDSTSSDAALSVTEPAEVDAEPSVAAEDSAGDASPVDSVDVAPTVETQVENAVVTDERPLADSADSGDSAASQPETDAEPGNTSNEQAASADAAEPNSEPTATAESAIAPAPAVEDRRSSEIQPEYPEEVEVAATAPLPIDVEKLARGWQVGREKLKWIAHCLHDPFGDPRLAEPPVPLLKEMPTLQTLEPGMCVWAVVVGVADFGAFVEIGPDCSGLIHISRLSANYIEDPHQCVQVGDLVMAWVVAVDEKKNRVALTALSPAQRAAVEAENAERRNIQAERRHERGGDRAPRGRGGQASVGGREGANRGGQAQRAESGRRGGKPRGGGHAGGAGRGGKGRGTGPAKPVVVTSKKPKAPISEAMKEGDEPLRSFSDLLQFYEAKRTPPPRNAEPSSSATQIVVEQEAEDRSEDTAPSNES